MLDKKEKKFFEDVTSDMDDVTATLAIHQLSIYLSRYYKKNVIILLDEYDTPMQEAYVNGYWDELAGFTRSMFNSTFKTNPYLLLASGYLKVIGTEFIERTGRWYYKLALTNKEVRIMFEKMVQNWFSGNEDYNDFIQALLLNDLDARLWEI